MTIKITAAGVEALVSASEVPTPIAIASEASVPINPMLFPNDWSIEVELRTRWSTDLTQSEDLHEDRWILADRPNRSLRARVVGMDKVESDALIQSAQASASQFGFPVPIYPDAVVPTQIEAASSNWVISGDFRFRRFFRGGRVVFLPANVDPLQSSEGVSFGRIVTVGPSAIEVQLEAGFTRPPNVEQDLIIPCMDVEMMSEAEGTALTDSVYAAEIEWVEIDGSSSLPATWPATSIDNPEVIAPLATVIDGKGLFPFSMEWSQGVQISVRRLMDSDLEGRTTVQSPSGQPFLEFSFSIMGYDREQCWKVTRFFDAHRGRAASFWLEHPMRPFGSLQSSTSTQVEVVGRGSPFTLLDHLRNVLITTDSGEQLIREVDGIVENADDNFQISWSDPVAGTIVSAQPVYMCRFDQDELSEGWSTDSVIPAMRFDVVEEPQLSEEASVAGSLGAAEPITAYKQIPDCTLFLRAGANCFDLNGKPCYAWPNSVNNARVWKDSITPVYREEGVQRLQQQFTTTNPATRVAFPVPTFRNNGQPMLINPTMQCASMLDSSLPIGERQLWSDTDGWTISFVITALRKTATVETRTLIDLGSSSEFAVSLSHDSTSLITGFDSYISIGPWSSQTLAEITEDPDPDEPACYTLRMGGSGEGNSLRVWVNGRAATASSLTAAIPNVTRFDYATIFNLFAPIPTGPSFFSNAWVDGRPGGCEIVSYKRALDLSELREVHRIIADKYLVPMQPATLY